MSKCDCEPLRAELIKANARIVELEVDNEHLGKSVKLQRDNLACYAYAMAEEIATLRGQTGVAQWTTSDVLADYGDRAIIEPTDDEENEEGENAKCQ